MADTQLTTPSSGSAAMAAGKLAYWIIIFSFGVIGTLGLAAIVATAWTSEKPYADVKDILSMLLPVIGAWAGTVIAYYFSKENFEAAASRTAALVEQLTSEGKLRSIPARDAMLPIEKVLRFTLDRAESAVKLKADLIDANLAKENRNRLPVLDPQGRPKYIVHRSIIDRFLVEAVAAGKTLADLTLQHLIDDTTFKEILVNGFGTVRETSTMAEAKALMDRVAVCLDVFVTEDGTADTKVVGWLTNVIVMEQARV